MKKKVVIVAFGLLFFLSGVLYAQDNKPPRLRGIAKMTYLISDYSLAQSYYGDFLGFDHAFSYDSPLGKVVSYKVNDRQYLEFVEDKDIDKKDRFVGLTFETENVEQMRSYLASKGVKTPPAVTVDGAGNKVFKVYDASNVPIEFLEWGERSLHRLSKGQYLSEKRISKRIHHAGLYSDKMEDNPEFYTSILGFKPFLRIPENKAEKPQILYFQIPGCVEFIEHYPSGDRNFTHPCLVAEDMQEVLDILEARRKNEKLADPMVGKGRRWILNLVNEDGTKVEFTEIFLAK